MKNIVSDKQPQIRFPEFTTEWSKVSLKKVAKRQKKKNTDNVYSFVLTNSAIQGIVSQQDYFDKDIANQNNLAGYYIVETDDFVYNPRISEHAPVGPVKRNHLQTGVMSPLYTIFRFTDGDNDFFEYYFESTYWHKYLYSVANYGARHDRMNITNDDFEKLPIPVPEIEEQQKIATFLKTIDEKISLLEEKKAQLEAYKQGMMQRLFPKKVGEQPQLRFKGDNGEMFGDWEEKRLGDVVNFVNGYIFKSEKYSNSGKYKIITIANVQKGKMIFDRISLIENLPNDINDDQVLRKNDILISMTGNVGRVCMVNTDFCLLNQRVGKLIVKNYVHKDFLFQYLLTDYFINKMESFAQGGAQGNLSKKDILNYKIFIPSSVGEQHKIIDFLSYLDSKISGVDEEINQMKEWKRGLLQRMFV